jgi:ABC-type multidrug transport system ATPase subunit
VILSTHIVDDVKELCTNMAIIHEGRLLLADKPQNAIENLQGKIWKKKITKNQLPEYQQNLKVISSKLTAGKPEIHVFNENKPDSTFEAVNVDLEDVFFSKIMNLNN